MPVPATRERVLSGLARLSRLCARSQVQPDHLCGPPGQPGAWLCYSRPSYWCRDLRAPTRQRLPGEIAVPSDAHCNAHVFRSPRSSPWNAPEGLLAGVQVAWQGRVPGHEHCRGELPAWQSVQRGTWLEPALLLLDKLQQIRGALAGLAWAVCSDSARLDVTQTIWCREQVQGSSAGDCSPLRRLRTDRAALVPGAPGQEDWAVLGAALERPGQPGCLACSRRAVAPRGQALWWVLPPIWWH